jgi:hypothetical protein
METYRMDRLCGLVVRIPGYWSQHYQIFWEVVGPERGPASWVQLRGYLGKKEKKKKKNSGLGLENPFGL